MQTTISSRSLVRRNLGNMLRMRCASFDRYESHGVLEVLHKESVDHRTSRKHSIHLSLRKLQMPEENVVYVSLHCDEDLETPLCVCLSYEIDHNTFKLECTIAQYLDEEEELYTEISFMFDNDDIEGIECTNWDKIVEEITVFSYKQVCPMPACKNMFMPNFMPENVCPSCAPFLTEEEASETSCIVCYESGYKVGMVHCKRSVCTSGVVCHVCFVKMCQRQDISCPVCRVGEM